MATYQDLLDAIALIVGGTADDPTNNPHFYSGFKVGDGTGLSGLRGCWSVAPGSLEDTPMALMLAGHFTISGPEHPDVLIPGNEWNVDEIRLQIFVANVDHRTSWSILNPYRDTVPTLFRSHMQLNATPNVLTAMIRSGKPGLMSYADTGYLGWEFVLQVQRYLLPSYTA